MIIKNGVVEKDEKGFNKILVELNEHDVVILGHTLKDFDKYDKDDYVYRKRLEDIKDQLHTAFTLVRPS